jgi:hypothetical protein
MAENTDAAEKPKEPNEERPSSGGQDLFAFTLDANTGQIIKLEKADSAGVRRQLSELEKLSLRSRKSWRTVEALVEQAFEAGIGCILGNEDEKDEAQDSEESETEAEVRRTLLQPLLERGRTKTLFQRKVLGQAILATALQQITASHAPEAEGSSLPQTPGAAGAPPQPGSARPAR